MLWKVAGISSSVFMAAQVIHAIFVSRILCGVLTKAPKKRALQMEKAHQGKHAPMGVLLVFARISHLQ